MRIIKTLSGFHPVVQIILLLSLSLLAFYLISNQGTLVNLLHLLPGFLVISLHFHSTASQVPVTAAEEK